MTTSGSSTATASPDSTHGLTTQQPDPSTSTTDPGATQTGIADDDSGDDDSTGGVSYTPACVDGCAVEATCGNEWSSELECISWCEDNLIEAGRFSPFCRNAWEGLHACLGTLDCPGFEDYLMGGRSCQIETFTHAVECEGQS
jgi:hypothetical protein